MEQLHNLTISDNKTINRLWMLPDNGKISNPYFDGKNGENGYSKNDSDSIPLIELDDTDSVHTPSTTDVSDDESLNNHQWKVNITKKKRRRRKQEIKKETYKSEQYQVDATSAISKPENKSETIAGLDSSKLTTTIEEINETPTEETINNEQKQSQASSDNFVKPMETNSTPTKVNTPTDTIKKEATLPTVAATVTNGTSTEIHQQDDPPQSTDKPKCIKIGCCNSAIEHIDWDFEYCSSRCAFEHCKTAFANWVTSRQLESGNSTTPAPTPPTVTTTSAN